MHRNHYFFDRKNPSSLISDKRHLTIVSNNIDNESLLAELAEFFANHELYTIDVDEDMTLICFADMCSNMVIYPDDNAIQMIRVEAVEWDGEVLNITIPIDRFGIYSDDTLIIGELDI